MRKGTAMPDAFDVVVIGGGSAGYAAARIAGQLGARVALVEGGPVGGLCILDGCMPSKALIRSADVLHLVRTVGELGIRTEGVRVDFAHIMARKERLVAEFASYRRQEIAEATGVTLIRGQAQLTDSDHVTIRPARLSKPDLLSAGTADAAPLVGRERSYSAQKIILATGSYAWIPPMGELHEVGYITSDEALALEAPPESMVVLGAGAIALELGQFYARMGTRITVLQRSSHIFSREDPEVGETLAGHLRDEGMEIFTDATLHGCYRQPDGRRVMVADIGGKRREFPGEQLFVALGRRASIHGLGLERAAVTLDETACFVAVDESLRTSHPDIYAAGDVATHHQMTHLAVLQGEVAGYNAARALGYGTELPPEVFLSPAARRLGGVATLAPNGLFRMDYSVVPQVLFTDPPFAKVGLNEREASAAGVPYVVASYSFADLGMAQVMGQTKGFIKMLADRRDGRILGVQILGHQADTLIHEAVMALAFGATAEQVARVPHFHPTLPEILTYPAEELAYEFARSPR